MLLNNLTVASLSKAKFNISSVKIGCLRNDNQIVSINSMYQQRLKQRSVMHKTSEKIAKQKKVLAKAVLSFAKQLGLTQDQLVIVLNLDSVKNLTSLELDPTSKQGEIALTLIRITTSLDALTGGDTAWMQHFMKSPNKLMSGIPIEQIQNPQGLASVLQLVEGLRAKL